MRSRPAPPTPPTAWARGPYEDARAFRRLLSSHNTFALDRSVLADPFFTVHRKSARLCRRDA
eukprot:3052975-Heterocapsa_arctica.AAC.1